MWRWLIQSAAIVACAAACSNSNGTGGQAGSPAASSPTTTKTAKRNHRRHVRHHRHRHTQRRQKHPSGIPVADVPRRSLTPGVALAVGTARICVSGYSASVRNVPTSESDEVYAEYGVAHVPYAHEVDHLISLELGGSNSIRNLWPEPYAGRWGARTKDVLENRLHDLVCSGQLRLHYAQHIEAINWVAAYRRYVGATPSGRSGSGSSGDSASSRGYYLSSYPSASTIYCADDSAWRELSKTYLRRYATYAAAHRAYPGYHLHQPC